MPDAPTVPATVHARAIGEADAYLREQCGARRLAKTSFAQNLSGDHTDGWRLACATSQAVRELDIYVDGQFPFSLPIFVLVDRPPFLTWPHIEENGTLCLVEGTCIARPEHTEHILATLMRDAYELIIASETGSNEADFKREFYSYWDVQPGMSEVPIRSLLRPNGPSRLVRVYSPGREPILGDSEPEITDWVANFRNQKTCRLDTYIACLLWLDSPLLPREYPRSPADLFRIASRSENGTSLLGQLAVKDTPPYYVVLGANSENGPCLAAVRLYRPETFDLRGRRRSLANNGFRPGNVPPIVAARRLFSKSTRMETMRVERVDGSWIHGRGRDPRQSVLSGRHVVIFGCGSVGGPLAQTLAMAGVGRLTLVDYQRLVWANVGRHPLGAQFVGRFKATGLAEFLGANYPHLRIEGHDCAAERFLQEQLPRMRPDLLISATANWAFERALNLSEIAGEFAAPVLYSWTERHACAGHAVFVSNPVQACLQCGLDMAGSNRKPVTEWPDNTTGLLSEPACGGLYQPYGPVELMGTVSIGASLSLDILLGKVHAPTHRIWAAPAALLSDAGGSWTRTWLADDPRRAQGGFQEDRIWGKDFACTACGGPQFGTLLRSASVTLASDSSFSQTC